MKKWIKEIEESLSYILENLDKNDIRFDEIAKLRNYSPYHFHRRFKEITGESVKNCLRRLRFERAVEFIRNSDKSITEIAFDSGYETLESFSKAFKKYLGITPGELRKKKTWYGKTLSHSHIHYVDDNISEWIAQSDMEDNMLVKIANIPPIQLVCLKNLGDYWKLPATWDKFRKKIDGHRIKTTNTFSMTIFFDHHNDVPADKKVSYVCSGSDHKGNLPEGLFKYKFPGGKYAILAHMGSYDEIGIVWEDFVKNFLSLKGWKMNPDLPSLEWYQNSPGNLSPDLWMTYLCEPVL
jgi:AraC-like DNA-binding protein/DNA gyrase inhibitor GyrI